MRKRAREADSGPGAEGDGDASRRAAHRTAGPAARDEGEAQEWLSAWGWKREHLPDKLRFQRPCKYSMDPSPGPPSLPSRTFLVHQASFSAQGFASTVWDSSIAVSKLLEAHPAKVAERRCLDLSAGCGIVAIVMAALGATSVVASDLGDNLTLLRKNVQVNGLSDTVTVVEHAWGSGVEVLTQGAPLDLVVACDVMYLDDTATMQALVKTLAGCCGASTECLVAHGRNDRAQDMFEKECERVGLTTERLGREEWHPRFTADDIMVLRLSRRQRRTRAAIAIDESGD